MIESDLPAGSRWRWLSSLFAYCSGKRERERERENIGRKRTEADTRINQMVRPRGLLDFRQTGKAKIDSKRDAQS